MSSISNTRQVLGPIFFLAFIDDLNAAESSQTHLSLLMTVFSRKRIIVFEIFIYILLAENKDGFITF
jgi:hypothetical protein